MFYLEIIKKLKQMEDMDLIFANTTKIEGTYKDCYFNIILKGNNIEIYGKNPLLVNIQDFLNDELPHLHALVIDTEQKPI